MANDTKPREFWISKELTGHMVVTTEETAKYMANAIYATPIHVIEKSAYDDLEKELEVLFYGLDLRRDEYIQQIGEWKHLQRLEEQVKRLEDELKKKV